MKIIFTFVFCCFISFTYAQRCGTTEYLKQHPAPFLSSPATPDSPAGSRDTLPNEVIVIPVVVHVLYNNSTQNISDQQVLSQITVLNNDYRRLNADAANTPAVFKGVAADSKIVFCVAKVDPNGNHTTGIIHKFTTQSVFFSDDGMKFSSGGGDDAWDSKKYLNIWVCSLFGRTLGYAVLPGGPPEKDGVVIQYNAFGTMGSVSAPFNKGRTTTHEIGHWLGLRHLWGDAVCGDDGIADTPPQQTSNSGCTSFPHTSSCSINMYGDMFMNFMDFTDDACMNMFTEGQKSEMRGQFALGGFRNSFLSASVCTDSGPEGGPLPGDTTESDLDISVYPNPFVDQLTINYKSLTETSGKTVVIYDITGKKYLQQGLKASKTVINLNNLPNGMYILKMESASKPRVFKLIKRSAASAN